MPRVFLTTRVFLNLTLTLALALHLGRAHAHANATSTPTTAADVIAALNLTANPEKGYYAQTFSDPTNVTFTAVTSGGNGSAAVVPYEATRAASTAIYYLLEGADGDSLWHRIDAVEVWHHYAGAPLRLRLSYDGGDDAAAAVGEEAVLGPDVVGGQRPQVVIGRWQWQSARSLGDWTLVGTTGEVDLFFLFFLFLFWCFYPCALHALTDG